MTEGGLLRQNTDLPIGIWQNGGNMLQVALGKQEGIVKLVGARLTVKYQRYIDHKQYKLGQQYTSLTSSGMLAGMASLESVSQKMHHAGQHWNELTKAVAAYLDTNPGALVEMPDSTPERKHWRYQNTSPLPARIGLLAGDCLQNMRSALDYLVWELVLANGHTPTDRTMFPISLTPKAYKAAIERKQVDGVTSEALAIIDALQPYKLPQPEMSALAALDYLTNVNKHRRVLLTSLHGAAPSVNFEFLHVPVTFERRDGDKVVEATHSRVYVAIDEGVAKPREICLILNTLARTLVDEVLPLFEQFFKKV